MLPSALRWRMKATWILPVAMLFAFSMRPILVRAQQADSLAKVFDGIQSGEIEVVDLTHPLDDQSPYWPEGQAASPFHASVVSTFEHDGYFARLITMPE